MTTLARVDATMRVGTTASPALGIGAIVAGGAGALLGIAGFLAVVVGDEMVALDVGSTIVATLAALGLVAAILVRDRPGVAAIGFAAAPIAYLVVLGGSLGAWWTEYQDALATSGAAENAFWSAMPAIGLFTMSGILLALGAVLAALGWLGETTIDGGIS